MGVIPLPWEPVGTEATLRLLEMRPRLKQPIEAEPAPKAMRNGEKLVRGGGTPTLPLLETDLIGLVSRTVL